MTRSSNRRVVVALAVWGALTGAIGTIFAGATTPATAHTCVSPAAGTPLTTVRPLGSCTSLPGYNCQAPGTGHAGFGVEVAFCIDQIDP